MPPGHDAKPVLARRPNPAQGDHVKDAERKIELIGDRPLVVALRTPEHGHRLQQVVIRRLIEIGREQHCENRRYRSTVTPRTTQMTLSTRTVAAWA